MGYESGRVEDGRSEGVRVGDMYEGIRCVGVHMFVCDVCACRCVGVTV